MATQTKLAQLLNGLVQNIDLKADEMQFGTVRLDVGDAGGTLLTKTILDGLINDSHTIAEGYQTITAGSGLTGGGGGASVTVNVGAGTGMTINADDIAIDFGTTGSKAVSATSLASTANGLGASLLGIEDSAGQFTGTTVEAGLTESLDAAQAAQVTADAAIPSSEKGAANGVATLDGASKLPSSQLPISAMEYKGAHNVATNSPTLIDGTGVNGDLYRVSVAGSRDYGSGSLTFVIGDAVIYNGTIWEKIPGDDLVQSVAGKTGAVTLDTDDVSEGSNLYFTDGRAQTAAVEDAAYGAGWNGDAVHAPSQNAVYDKIESLSTADTTHTQADTDDWTVADASSTAGHLDELADRMVAVEAGSDGVLRDFVAGESFSINTTYSLRLAVSGETDGRVYKTGTTAAAGQIIGSFRPTAAISAGTTISVVMSGEVISSVAFTASADEGKAVYADASGLPTVTPPSSGAIIQMGMVLLVGAAGTAKIIIQSPRLVGVA